ncbi:MAG: pitrilysin family protein [Actinomycetota bacterium]
MIFEKTVLPGGVRVLTERMPEVLSVSLGFWVGVGSRDEPTDLQGSSHFLEHLLFKGTEHRSARDIAETFDAVGGEANAFSTKEYTCFYGRVIDKDLPMAMEVLTDMLSQPSLAPSDVESERNVILEELALHEDTPEDLVHDLFCETIFADHPLGAEVMGTTSTVKAITPESLGTFHSDNYHALNVVVSAAGAVDHGQVVDAMAVLFGQDNKPALVRTHSDPTPRARLKVAPRTTEQSHLVLGGLGYAREHPSRFAWGVLDVLLGGGMSSRLFQEVRERRGLAYSIYSYRTTFSETGSWAVYAGISPNNAAEVLKVITHELDSLLTDGITERELERAKGHMRGGVVLGLEDPSSRMSRLGKSELMHGEILTIDEIVKRVDAVTTEDVSQVAQELLQPESRILTVIGPFSEDDFPDWN